MVYFMTSKYSCTSKLHTQFKPKVRPSDAMLKGNYLLFYLFIFNEIGGKEGESQYVIKTLAE